MAVACCTRRCCLYACTVISAALLVLSGLTYVIINPIVITVMTNEFVINSPDAVRYYDWSCKFSVLTTGDCEPPHDAVPFTESYFLFNLTNYEDVLNGAFPIYHEIGPYTYQVSITKFNIEFKNNNETVSYIEATTYYWLGNERCPACKPEDVIVGINTGYLGAVQTATSETLLRLGLSGPSIDRLLKSIRSAYIDQYLIAEGRQTQQAVLDTCAEIDSTCTTLDQAAIVQWYYRTGTIINPTIGLYNDRMDEILPAVFPNPAEFSTTQPWSIAVTEQLLYGDHSIVEDPLALLELAGLAADTENPDAEAEMIEKWGVNRQQFASFGIYILGISSTYNDALMRSVINLDQGGGLFSARTVYQWVYDFADPLLLLLQPGDPQTAIRHNDTDFADAASYKVGVEIFTGQGDINTIADVIYWNGTNTVNYWAEPYAVGGNNQDGQFAFRPNDNKGKQPGKMDPYPVWSPDHARTVDLVDTGVWVNTPQGIPTRRFVLANETYDIDPFFYQDYFGFVNGSVYHSDPPFRKRLIFNAIIPLFMSQPRFFYTDPLYADKVTILNVTSGEKVVLRSEECMTIVDIEPISGNAMYAKKRLQVNFLVTNATSFDLYYPNVQKDMFWPSLWVEQSSEITDDLADEWLGELGLGLTIEKVLFIAGLTICSFSLLMCIIFIARMRKADKEYEPING